MNGWLKAMRKGSKDFENGRWEDAIKAFERAVRVRPGRVEGWVNLASVLLQAYRLPDAERAWREAVKRRPDLSMTWLGLGRALGHQHRPNEAESAFRKALAIERTAEILNDLGVALRDQQRQDEALECFQQACPLDPSNKLAAVNLATTLLLARRFPEAREHIDALRSSRLPPELQDEVEASHLAMQDRERLLKPVNEALRGNDIEPLVAGLAQRPVRLLDPVVTTRLDRCVRSLQEMASREEQVLNPVPASASLSTEDRQRLEALLMIPVVEEVEVCAQAMTAIDSTEGPEWDETRGMLAAVVTADALGGLTGQAVRDEATLRLCHARACQAFPDMLPGHFKLVRNKAGDPRIPKAQPDRVVETLHHFLERQLPAVPTGAPRAALLFMGLSDIHPFADGNGRVALALLNREMERNGEQIVLLDRTPGRLGEALRAARYSEGDMRPLLEVFREGQFFATHLMSGLRQRASVSG